MTPARLSAILARLRWSQRGLAERLGYASDSSVQRWKAGAGPVPDDVAAWLEALDRWADAQPPPPSCGTRSGTSA